MTAPYKTWTVKPHGELTQINEKIWIADGEIDMPIGKFPRRMSVVRLAAGGLVIYSAIALDEANMSHLEALGPPEFLVVPSERHRLDAPGYVSRFPNIQVITPTNAREKVEDVARVHHHSIDGGLVAAIDNGVVRLTANSDVAVTLETRH